MSGKLFLTKSPALPARCAVCYTDAGGTRDYIDFGSSIDFYGAILICELCMHNAAELIGYVPVAKNAEAQFKAEKITERYLECLEKVAALEHLIRAYAIDSDSFGLAGTGNDSDVPLEFEKSEDAGDNAAESINDSEAGEGDFPRPVKSSSV